MADDNTTPGNERAQQNQHQPATETPAAQPPPNAAPRSLAELADAAPKGRLSNADEDRATALMKDGLLSGGEDFLNAMGVMPKFPWILCVRAIEQAWPQLVEGAKPFLLEGLAKMDGDHALRLRLSVSRALARIDLPVGVKIAAGVCRDMVNLETGALSAEHSKLIGNVFIGRGKPWVLQFPLDGLDAPVADAVVAAVVYSAFNVNNPPITQLSILRYAGPRLAGLHANTTSMVAKSVARWSRKWQSALKKDVPTLPEPIATVLDGVSPEPEKSERNSPTEPAPDLPIPAELEEKLKQAAEAGDPDAVAAATQEINAFLEASRGRPAAPATEAGEPTGEAEEKDDKSEKDDRRGRGRGRGRDRDRDRDRERERERDKEPAPRPEKKERPAYVSREQEARGSSVFNLHETLRSIDKYVAQLRNDLTAAQNRLRRADTGGRRSADRPILSPAEGNLTPDELKRLIIQLEARIATQEEHITELRADAEARAACMAAGPDGQVPDAVTQLRTFLATKLNEDWADYLALENREPDQVVQQHHRTIIRHIFSVLIGEGIPLTPITELPPPPAEVLPVPPAPVIEEGEEEDEEDHEELDQIPEPEIEEDDDDDDEDDDADESEDDADGDDDQQDGEEDDENGEKPDESAPETDVKTPPSDTAGEK